MRIRLLSLITLVLPLNSLVPQTPSQPLNLIPAPQRLEVGAGSFIVAARCRIVLGTGTAAADRFAAEQINQHLIAAGRRELEVVQERDLRRLGTGFIYIGPGGGEQAASFLKERHGELLPQMAREGYFLDVAPGGVVILAASPTGRFYGVMTLLQLLTPQGKSLVLPAVRIHDWPAEQFRGITDDLSRGQVSTAENFKAIIRFLARYKLNVYSPYIEDIFAFKHHPLIGKGRGALTSAEVRELDAYARQFHVQLIPIFETLGHWENILVKPEYVGLAEFPGAHTLNVSDERVYALLDEMIGELADVFSSPYFNMAADESWDVGLGASKALVKATDLATVHANHYNRLFTILRKYGKTPLMYGDIILNNPSILEKIPKDVIIVDWQYWAGPHYPSATVFHQAGFPFLVSPAVWNFTGPFPNYLNTFVNIRNFNRDGYENGALGLLTSNWNDYGGEALRELNYYGYAWTAECAWRPEDADEVAFAPKFFLQEFGNKDASLTAQIIYTLLGQPSNQYLWVELWRHPMLPPRELPGNASWRIEDINTSMPLVKQLAGTLREQSTRNRAHADYLEFIADLNLWFAWKQENSAAIRRMAADSTVNFDSLKSTTQAMATHATEELHTLKDRFRTLWLRTNLDANLQLLLDRYDQQVAYWQETAAAVARGDRALDPTIPSAWIYHPDAHPRTIDSTLSQTPTAYFRKTLDLEGTPHQAVVQLLGDTYARLWVNGTAVGEVYARRSLSLTVERERVKIFDITTLLKPGKNVFAVEATAYQPLTSGGFNLYGELAMPAGLIATVMSDSTWRVAGTAPSGWMSPGFDDSSWLRAARFPYPTPVIKPNFAARRYSWIER